MTEPGENRARERRVREARAWCTPTRKYVLILRLSFMSFVVSLPCSFSLSLKVRYSCSVSELVASTPRWLIPRDFLAFCLLEFVIFFFFSRFLSYFQEEYQPLNFLFPLHHLFQIEG